jgi:AraC-like DNA-binding protein
MGYRRFPARGALADYVESFWLFQNEAARTAKERTLPTGTMGIVVNLREKAIRLPDPDRPGRYASSPAAIVIGPSSRHGEIERRAQSAVAGVQFRPGGGFPFFGYPAGDFQDLTVSLEDVWGAAARELRERLLAAPDTASKVRALEEALLAQARPVGRHPGVSYAVRELRRVPARLSVLEMTDEAGLSAKRFIQLFREQVGLPPKLFGRVRRFQAVVERVHGRERVGWADVALAAGYYDQAHLVHEFRAFTGLTPRAYLAARGEFLNHVPLPG